MNIVHFYAYTPNGEIVSTGHCIESQLKYQAFPGATIAEGRAEFGKQYRASDGTLKPIPPKPSEYHKFDYNTKQWVADVAAAWAGARAERDRRLQETDWTQLPDVPLETKEAWAVYRQALRDITEQPDPFNIQWPVPPGA